MAGNYGSDGVGDMSKEVKLLRNMAAGERGIVTQVKTQGELGRRIRDMGLVPGTTIQVQGRAPLKDPVAIRVRDFTLSLRNSEADFIYVEVESDV
jgi:ferrous iron transport protein A